MLNGIYTIFLHQTNQQRRWFVSRMYRILHLLNNEWMAESSAGQLFNLTSNATMADWTRSAASQTKETPNSPVFGSVCVRLDKFGLLNVHKIHHHVA